MDLNSIVQDLYDDKEYVKADRVMDSRLSTFSELELHDGMEYILEEEEINNLYKHQVDRINSIKY